MPLVSLPIELQLLIFDFLSLNDCKSVSLTHSSLNANIQSHLFASLRCEWQELPDLYQKPFAKHMQSLRILGSGEWKFSPYLCEFVKLCPFFTTLTMQAMSSSSGWLKYLGPPVLPVTSMAIECIGTNNPRFFDFEHILGIPQLSTVKLTNFNVITPPTPHPAIRDLELINCTWEYPSDLSEIGDIETLSICLSTPLHPFALSERLQHVATNPPPRLQELYLHIDTGRPVHWKPLHNGSPSLRIVSLRGFEPASYQNLPNLSRLTQN